MSERATVTSELLRWLRSPHSRERLSATEAAVRRADLTGDAELAFAARLQLVDAATFTGHLDKALVAFAWCLGRHLEDPETYFECRLLVPWRGGPTAFGDLFWRAKYVLASIDEFHEINREQIERVFEQMAEAHRRRGRSLRPLHSVRALVAQAMGDREVAEASYRAWAETPRDGGTDCVACETHHQALWCIRAGHPRRALRIARPVLEGQLRCHSVPRSTLAHLLLPLMRLGEVERAVVFHRRGYRQVRLDHQHLEEVSAHLRFLVLTENLDVATTLFREHAAHFLETPSPLFRFWCDLSSWMLFEKLLRTGDRSHLTMALPPALEACRESSGCSVSRLRDVFRDRTRANERAFNARNGNTLFSDHVEDARLLVTRPMPHPLG